jgi:predicted O-methyltransferase YrrM
MSRVGHLRRTARAVARHPRHGLQDTWEDLRALRDRPAPALEGAPAPLWGRRLHELLGAPWPCPQAAAFEAVWEEIQSTLQEAGLRSGRGAYGGWDDGDPGLARAVWCVAAHLPAERSVETGVGRGITSRTILDVLAPRGAGHLWSIDLPLLHRSDLDREIGIAVAPERRDRWTLIEGSSRRKLPSLLERLGSIDLFVHDSLHSERNVRFELEHAWPFVRAGGAVVVDDVHLNAGFAEWSRRAADAESIICRSDDGSALFAIAVKKGLAAVTRAGARPSA